MMRYIKTLLLAVTFLLANNLQAQPDAISSLFENYMEDDAFSVIYISPKMFQMVSKLEVDDMDDEMMQMIKDLRGLRILTTDKEPRKYYNRVIERLDVSDYEVLMTVKGDEEDVRFWIKEEEDIISELLLLVGGDDEFVLMSFIGKLNLNQISKLSKSIQIDGSEHLEKIEDHR